MNKKDIKSLIEDINVTLLPSGELLVDTKYANEAKSVRLMDREGFTRVFEEPKTKSLTKYVEELLRELERLKGTSCRDCERFGDYHYCKDCYGYDLFKSED